VTYNITYNILTHLHGNELMPKLLGYSGWFFGIVLKVFEVLNLIPDSLTQR